MNNQIAVLGDTHFDIFAGLKQERMYEYQEKFFKEVFFPEILSRNIKTVLQLGDLFDSRIKISQRSLAFSKRIFFDVLRDNNIELIVLTGNHDIFYKDSLKIVTAEQVLGEYDNIKLIKKPTQMTVNGLKCAFIPWICKENEASISHFIETDDSTIAFGHLELAGGKLNKYAVQEHGSDIGMFKKYKKVYSGHFHSPSVFNNVQFVGVPYELTRIDCNEQKSFLIIESGAEQIQIDNPNTHYEQIVISSTEEAAELFKRDLDNKYVELSINYDIEQKAHEKLANKLNETFMMYDLHITTKKDMDKETLLRVDVSKIQSNRDLVVKYSDENNLSKLVANKLIDLYNKAEAVEA